MLIRTVIAFLALVAIGPSAFAQRDGGGDRGGRERPDRDVPDRGFRDRPSPDRGSPPLAPSPSFDTIALNNRCGSTISVAVAAYDGSNWIASGWWQVAHGQTVTTDVRSTSRSVYFYARTATNAEWNGSDRPDSASVWVVNERFSGTLDAQANKPGSRIVSFFKKDTGEAYGTYTQRFVCNQ